MAAAASSLAFTARRGDPELVAPAEATPRGIKRLSDIDDQDSFRFYRSIIFFYRAGGRATTRDDDDPARVIRDALAAALVHYYPLAGRLRELPCGKLVGFYGNALTFGVARTTAGELCSGPLSRAVELIAAALVRTAADGYTQSVADTLVLRGRPRFTTARTYLVTDLTKSALHVVDLGWGRPVFGGPATTTLATFHMPASGGGIILPMGLPPRAMETFAASVRAGLAAAAASCGVEPATKAETKIPFPTPPLLPLLRSHSPPQLRVCRTRSGGGTEATGGASNGEPAWSSNPRPGLPLTPRAGGAVAMQRLLAGSLVASTPRLLPIADSFLRRRRPLRSPLPVLLASFTPLEIFCFSVSLLFFRLLLLFCLVWAMDVGGT
ncbi:hypothetical protein ABZP36_007197 [Zizania latifolia]